MAMNLSIVTQRILVPHGRVNGQQLYEDYGLQYIWLYDMDDDPPTVIKSGLAPSGKYEIEAANANAKAGYGVGEFEPVVKHIPHWDSGTEGSGVINTSGSIAI